MKIKSILTFFSLCALLFCKTTFADNRPGAFVLTPGVGPYFFDTNRDLKNNAMYNLNVGYDFTSSWGVEALAGILRTKTTDAFNQNVTANLYSLDGVYHFNTCNPLVPYVLAGGGILNLNPNTVNSNAQANLNAGAGLEYFLGNSVALRSDVRDVYTMQSSKSDIMWNFGISFLLGGQKPVNNSAMCAATATDPCSTPKVLIRFVNKSSSIDPIYLVELQPMVNCLQRNPNLRVNLDGYANCFANAHNNLILSQQRAMMVKDYLVSHAGIDPSRINAQGFGIANSESVNSGQSDSVMVSVFNGHG